MLSIAGLPVCWQDSHIDFVKDFISADEVEPLINFEFCDSLINTYSVQYPEREFAHFLKTSGGEMLFADSSWSNVSVYGTSDNNEYSLPLAALCSKFSYYNTILVHSSLVDFNGDGIMFIGPSGIGKTTQAQLWNKFKNAVIINGDKAFVRVVDGSVYAYGLPWKGSSPYSMNRHVVLKAIVVLSQSEKNIITRLDNDSLESLMPHVFFPHWDKECLNKSLDTLAEIADKVPVYALGCKPDENSVQLVHNTVFR